MLTSESTDKSFVSFGFLFLRVKFDKVECTRNIPFRKKKKKFSNLYTKRFIIFPLNNSPGIAWDISERY